MKREYKCLIAIIGGMIGVGLMMDGSSISIIGGALLIAEGLIII